ncbi:HET-domain-containing protein [Xylariaceae sp. FL0662B]|nr:HET-domain-containing protein [Xylariaceae sp. FL0662B]
MESFKGKSPHKPLRDDGTEIRIVNLLPNDFGAPIECKLEHIVLEPGADYEAVSYHWGDATVTKPILLDGRTYPVTINLFSGLQYLRLEDSPRRLWVDSLCINQTDTEERGREVRKMNIIYKYASGVLIWLGDYEPYTRLHVKRLFDFVRKLATNCDRMDAKALISRLGYEEIWRWQEELRDFIGGRQWFERIWVLQEISGRPRPWLKHSKITPSLICGHLLLSFAHLRAAVTWWSEPIDSAQLGLPLVCPSLERLSSIWAGHQWMNENKDQPFGKQLAWLLAAVASIFKATDKRDMVYAILGLTTTEKVPVLLQVDYKKSLQQVLTDCATFIINEVGQINIIQCNSMRTERLPSWVPDWQQGCQYKMLFDINPYQGTYCKILNKGAVLEVDMVALTNVGITGPMLEGPKSIENTASTLRDFFLSVEECLNGRPTSNQAHKEFRKALWRLFLAFDLHACMQIDPGWHLNAIKNDPPFLLELGASLVGHDTFYATGMGGSYDIDVLRTLTQTIEGKYLFRCIDGSIGIMNQPMAKPQLGDIISSIKGAYSEFVLRPIMGGYRIIGRCERTLDCLGFGVTEMDIIDWENMSFRAAQFDRLWRMRTSRRITIH